MPGGHCRGARGTLQEFQGVIAGVLSDLCVTTSRNGGREGFGFWSRQLSERVFGMLGSVSRFLLPMVRLRCPVSSYSSVWLFADTAVKTRGHRGARLQFQV